MVKPTMVILVIMIACASMLALGCTSSGSMGSSQATATANLADNTSGIFPGNGNASGMIPPGNQTQMPGMNNTRMPMNGTGMPMNGTRPDMNMTGMPGNGTGWPRNQSMMDMNMAGGMPFPTA